MQAYAAVQEDRGPLIPGYLRHRIGDPIQLSPVEVIEGIRFILATQHFPQHRHALWRITQGVLAEINEHHGHTGPLQSLDQFAVTGAGAVPLNAEDRQVGAHAQHALEAEAVSRRVPHPGDTGQGGETFKVLGIADGVGLFKIRQEAGQPVHHSVTFQDGEGRNIAAFAKHHPLDLHRDLDRSARKVGHRAGCLGKAGLKQKYAAQQGGDCPYRNHSWPQNRMARPTRTSRPGSGKPTMPS